MRKIKIKVNEDERNLMIKALVEKRNQQIRKNRPADPLNDLIIKLMK